MKKETINKIRGSWYTVNIKAYENQTRQHYIDALKSLIEKDPLVKIQGNRHISVEGFDYVGDKNTPKMIVLRLCAYDIMDPEAFFDIRKKQQVVVDLSPDIVSNKKSGELYFVPDVHRLMVLKSSKITLNQLVKYLRTGFDMIGCEDEFDVNIEVSSELIDAIERSYMIYSLEASISYSNHDPSSNFVKFFDDEMNDSGTEKAEIKLKSGKGKSLKLKKDGLISAILHLVKSNGFAKARIKKTAEASPVTIETKDYPEIVHLEGKQDNVLSAVRNHLIKAYGSE